jgi:ABC-type multidrug transport system ATPase subunit
MNERPVFSLKEVSKSFRKTQALKEISLDINASEITGIIGPDGAGKSTLFKILSGILSYDGIALFKGEEIRKNPELIKRSLSYMPQGIGQNLYMDLTVEENIHFFATLKDVPKRVVEQRAEMLLQATGLQHFRQRFAWQLSGGMKQKLGICCALISEPEVLILDEPSTGIDPLSRRQLWEILNEYLRASGTTVVFGTSYMDEAEKCHSIMFLHRGESLYRGHPEELMQKKRGLEDAFFEILLASGEELKEAEVPVDGNMRQREGEVIVEGVVKRFDSFVALKGVSLTVKPGEVFGLLGPNGAGKTTLIKCMVGLLRPEEGKIRLSGLEPGSTELRFRIGYMSQIFSLYGDLTVKENIQLYGTLYGIKGRLLKERMQWIINFSGLKGKESTVVKSLPLGMKQRLALGCATIHLPSVLFLDEPTSGVDPVARRLFWDFIKKLSNSMGITVIVTTHNLVEADFCDRVAIMNEGEIIALGEPWRLKEAFTSTNGEVYELYPEAPLPAEWFSESSISLVPYGRRYHLWRKGLSVETIKEILENHGVGYHYIKRIPPPMEDVFVYYLTGQKVL